MIDNAHMAVICSSVLLLDGGLDMPLCNVSVVRKGCDTMLPDIFTKYQQEMEDVVRAADEIYIVNAGRMNHGKSSLFNSLLDQEVFKADDVRTTVENQPVMQSVQTLVKLKMGFERHSPLAKKNRLSVHVYVLNLVKSRVNLMH